MIEKTINPPPNRYGSSSTKINLSIIAHVAQLEEGTFNNHVEINYSKGGAVWI